MLGGNLKAGKTVDEGFLASVASNGHHVWSHVELLS